MTDIVERLRKLSAETTLMQSIPVQEAARYIEFLESSWDKCRSECEDFHMEYRMKYDAETKVLHDQLATVTAERDELVAALKSDD